MPRLHSGAKTGARDTKPMDPVGDDRQQKLCAKLMPMGFTEDQIRAACVALGDAASEAALVGFLLSDAAATPPADSRAAGSADDGDAKLRAMGFSVAQIASAKDAVGDGSLQKMTDFLLQSGGASADQTRARTGLELVKAMKHRLRDFSEVQVENAIQAVGGAGGEGGGDAEPDADAIRKWIEGNLAASMRPSVNMIRTKLLELGLAPDEAQSKAETCHRSTSTLKAAINLAIYGSLEEGGAVQRQDIITGQVLSASDMFICECAKQHMLSYETFFTQIVADVRGGRVPACPLSAAEGENRCNYTMTQKETEDVIAAVMRSETLRQKLVSKEATSALLELVPDQVLVNGQHGWRSKLVSRLYLQRLKTEEGFIACPREGCGWFGERRGAKAEGGASEGQELPRQAPDGRALSESHARHMVQHRFRCKACSDNFCAGCKAVPYHAGFTCEEFAAHQEAKRCRFCDTVLTPANTSPGGDAGVAGCVCTNDECEERKAGSCGRLLACGHVCCGVRGEEECLPCLEEDCKACDASKEDFCNICYAEALGAAPVVRLECGHFFHSACVRQRLLKKWSSSHIAFNFLLCPLCNQDIQHASLRDTLAPLLEMRTDVRRKAELRLTVEGLDKDSRLTEAGGRYFEKPGDLALDILSYYTCFKCQQPYYGGQRQCDAGVGGGLLGGGGGGGDQEDFDPAELVCGGCAQQGADCATHGAEYIQWKCKFCCSPAIWFCRGDTHFCDPCHRIPSQRWEEEKKKDASALPACPGADACCVNGNHPPAFSEHCLGCTMCKANAAF